MKTAEQIAESEGTETEKSFILSVFVSVYTPVMDYVVSLPITSPQERIERSVLTLYWTGNAIEKAYGSNPAFIEVACKAWKEGVKLQRKFYSYTYGGNKAEDYAEKIKKVEPGYVMPNKAGCISLG